MNEWYGVVGAIISVLTFLLYARTYWRTVLKDARKEEREMAETIERLERELREEKEDNRRLARENGRLMRLVARLDQNGSH